MNLVPDNLSARFSVNVYRALVAIHGGAFSRNLTLPHGTAYLREDLQRGVGFAFACEYRLRMQEWHTKNAATRKESLFARWGSLLRRLAG